MSRLRDGISIGFRAPLVEVVVRLFSYHSTLHIRLLASWIPCLLLIDHTTFDFVNDDGDPCAAMRSPGLFLC